MACDTTIALPITGIRPIDQNHQRLGVLLAQLQVLTEEAGSATIDGAMIDELVEFTRHQLAREEVLLSVTGFPGLEEHQEDHQRVHRFCLELRRDHQAGQPAPCSAVLDVLCAWHAEHLVVMDAPAAEHLHLKRGDTAS